MVERHSVSDSLSNRGTIENFEKISTFSLPIIRDQHLTDKRCFTCKSFFGVPGLANKKKEICEFCYRASCSNCMKVEYFHYELQRTRPMCTTCYYKLLDFNEKLENLVKKYRLQRSGLKKEIKLLIEQRKQLALERANKAKQVEKSRENYTLLRKDKESVLVQLKDTRKKLKEKEENLKNKAKDLDLRKNILNSQFNTSRQVFAEAELKKKKELSDNDLIRKNLNEVYFKISRIRNFGEVQDDEESNNLAKEEIRTMEYKLKEINRSIKKMSSSQKGLISRKEKNNERILKLINELKSEEGFSKDEEIILASLRNQLIELDDLLVLDRDLLKTSEICEKNRKSYKSSIFESKISEVKSMDSYRRRSSALQDQKSCMKACCIF